MLLPGLTRHQQEHVADVLHRVGTVPHRAVLPLFMDVDRAGVRATTAGRPSDETVETVIEDAADQYQVKPVVAAFAFGLAIGLRDGIRFGMAQRLEKQRRRIDEDYYRLDEDQRADIRRLIRILRRGGSLAVLTSESQPQEQHSDPKQDATTAREWMRQAGVAARARR